MPPGKSYSFVKFDDEQTALNVYNNIHGKNNDFYNGILYLAFAKSSKQFIILFIQLNIYTYINLSIFFPISSSRIRK